MKNLIIFLLILLIVSCKKENPEPPGNENPACQADGKSSVEIYNGLHVKLRVEIRLNNGGPWSTFNGTYFYKDVLTGQKWNVEVPVGEYIIGAKGEEPGPYAHNSYDFNEVKDLKECGLTKVDY